MPEPKSIAPNPSGVNDAEPTLNTLKTWVFTVGRLVEARSSKISSDIDKSDTSGCMRYVAGNLKDINEEFEKYAVKSDDWGWFNLAGKFRLIMKDRTAVESKSAKQTLDSLRPDLTTALDLVHGCSSNMDFPTTDDAHLADCIKYIATALTGITERCDKAPTPTSMSQPWDNYTLKGKVNELQADRLRQAAELKRLNADELQSVKAAYSKLRKDLAEEASYTVKDDKERRRRLQRILAGKEVQHPDDLTDPDV